MKDLEYRTMDKSAWGDGPWQHEPDKMQFVDAATGLPCLIVRNRFGALCGYVGVSKGHPYYGKVYDDPDVSVHGGLTFADFCDPKGDEAKSICHKVEPGEDDQVYWLGFDMAHAYDYVPGMRKYNDSLSREEIYRDIGYVKTQCARLAKQLAEIK
jgi:hypothetical protein